MRITSLAATASLAPLAACGGAQDSQANIANIANAAQPAMTATASAVTPAGTPVSKQKAALIMKQRKDGMEAVGKATKAIKRELGGAPPDLAVVRASAAKISQLSRKASAWFPAGTGPDAGKTRAKADIWDPQNSKDFASKLGNFQEATKILSATASGNDLNAAKASFAKLGGTCKACHDKYRAEEKR